MTIDIDALEALARAATPGPWRRDADDFTRRRVRGPGDNPLNPVATAGVAQNAQAVADARYIAAASPDVVLALIARVREAEAARACEVEIHKRTIDTAGKAIGERDEARATLRAAANRARGIAQSAAADEQALAVLGPLVAERDAAIEQRDAARAEVAAMSEMLRHAAHARGAVEEYPDGTDELSLALERAEKAEAACAALLTELHALRAEVGWLRKVRDAAEALIAPHGSLAKMRDVGIDQRAITIERLRAALDAKGGG